MSKESIIAVCATGWGPTHGGINAFNTDFCLGMAQVIGTGVSLICIVTDIVSEEQQQQATDVGIQLLSYTNPLQSESEIQQALQQLFGKNPRPDWWVGHDTVTGPLSANFCKIAGQGQVAIFQHMDYAAYQVEKKQDGNLAYQMSRQQEENLANADQVFGVGPKLADAARRLLKRANPKVTEIVPGLATIHPVEKTDSLFQVITFGRMGDDDDRIKQGRLAAASAAKAAKSISRMIQREVWLRIIGFPNESSEYKAQFDALRTLVSNHAERRINLLPISYTENRQQLFDQLVQSHASLMLSLHEGFGLVGWEAIAAAVPLIVSTHSGLFAFLEREHLDGCVFAIDIKAPDANQFSDEDIQTVARALEKIAVRQSFYQKRADHLLAELQHRGFQWKSAAAAFCDACGIQQRAPTFTSTSNPTEPSDVSILKIENQHKENDELIRTQLATLQDQLKSRDQQSSLSAERLLEKIQSMRKAYANRKAPAISEQDYALMVETAKRVARDFGNIPQALLEALRFHGIFYHNGAWDGVDAALHLDYFPLQKHPEQALNSGWDYQWEVVGRLIKTFVAFLHFPLDKISNGYREDGWLLGKPLRQPCEWIAWVGRSQTTGSSIHLLRFDPAKDSVQPVARFVARNSPLRDPQFIVNQDQSWSLIATDGLHLYRWNLQYSVPIEDIQIQKGPFISYLPVNKAGKITLFGVTNNNCLWQLHPPKELAQIPKNTQLVWDASEESLYGITPRRKVAPGLSLLSIQTLVPTISEPVVLAILVNPNRTAPRFIKLPKMNDLLSRAGISKFDSTHSLALDIPPATKDPYPSDNVDIQHIRVQTLHQRTLLAINLQTALKDYYLALINLKQPAKEPYLLTTDQHIFDVRLIEMDDQVLLVSTLLPGGTTQHALGLWRWEPIQQEFVLLTLAHATDTGEATDLHVFPQTAFNQNDDSKTVNSASKGFTALYRFRQFQPTGSVQSLWKWTWPDQQLIFIGALPDDAIEGESASC